MAAPTIITAGSFDFTGSYTPPTWSGIHYYNFGISSVLYQIWTDDTYVYAATSSGLDIIDIDTEYYYAEIPYSPGFITVWASDDRVYLGTTAAGMKYLNKTCISGSLDEYPYYLDGCLHNYTTQPLTSDYVKYIHGNGDFLMCCTDVGVDVIKQEPRGYRSYTTVSGAEKCFMTSTGKFYYTTVDTTVSGSFWSVNRVDRPLVDWSDPDYEYGDPLDPLRGVTDIFVTEGTAADGVDNTLFVATTSGVYVIDESDLSYHVYYVPPIAGTSNHIVAVWAYEGKMYAATSDTFSVINLTTHSLIDYYDQTYGGVNDETLNADDIVDINANM